MSDKGRDLKAKEEEAWANGAQESVHDGRIGVRIQLMMPDELRKIVQAPWEDYDARSPIQVMMRHAMFDAREDLYKALQRAQMMQSPGTAAMVERTMVCIRGVFVAADLGPIYMERVANEYHGDDAMALCSPWFMVTTSLGHFKVGWRKQVINLDWSRTKVPANAITAAMLTGNETTIGDTYIHAWGYGKLAEYLKMLSEQVKP